ncbi:hypothetical protein BDP81DRAFT_398658 [Colletotrichum phormii]|uniref:LysM domain-containing protein n=1 Tax=Colletotrichum phormii TaxID=359342 RepID=A0AAI9ZH22_9PEZI|nr:uncharacterized protein BDP81DRAFT_398658 [Colletotrichum phormii]KAK1624127.1 hypothetical protein BDP81DRAFT_398658 [Colletotrichum phormii]
MSLSEHAEDSCFSIAAANGISEAQFLSWNPSVGANCGGMWAAAYVCVRTLDFVSPTTATPTTTTSPTTTKTPGNGIETPQPTQPGMISNCDKFYFVKTDESCVTPAATCHFGCLVLLVTSCASIAASQGISVAQFLAWNPMAVSV